MKDILTILFLYLFVVVTNAQIANQPNDLMLCDDNGDGIAEFDLTVTEPEILGAQDPSDFIIIFYINQTDATNSTNPILSPLLFYNSINPQAIFVRLEAISNGNFDTTNFALIVTPLPSPSTPTPLEVCDDDGDGFTEFVLNDKDVEIINGEPDIIVYYFETLAGADIGDPSGALTSPYVNINPFSQFVYARVVSDVNGCYSIVELELVVLDDCPIIDTDPIDLFINEGDNDGSAIFDLTKNELLMLGSQDPAIYLFSYHESLEDSMDDVNAVATPAAYQNIANPQTIYVRLANNTNGSYVLTSFLIETDGVLSIIENSLNNLRLYPNPVIGNVTLQSQFLISESIVAIYNMLGQQVFSEKVKPENGKIIFSISELNSGMYFLKLTSDGNVIKRRLIKN